MKCLEAIMSYLSSMILRPHKIQDSATEHVPNLVCVQHYCSQCETCVDIDEDYECCRKRKHSFFEDPVGDLLTHLCEPRGKCEQVVAIAHNARSYDAQFILKRAILLKWKPGLNLNGSKIICMRMEHLRFIDSISTCLCRYVNYPRHLGCQCQNRGTALLQYVCESELCGSNTRH